MAESNPSVVEPAAFFTIPHGLKTPTLLIDPDVITEGYSAVEDSMPSGTLIRFRVTCNPAPVVLRTLDQLGASFDVCSALEMEILTTIGVSPNRVLHAAKYRSTSDIIESDALGLHRWTVDSVSEIRKLAALAPASRVSIRLQDGGAFPALVSDDLEHVAALVEAAAGHGLQVDRLEPPPASAQSRPRQLIDIVAAMRQLLDRVDRDAWPRAISLGDHEWISSQGFPIDEDSDPQLLEALADLDEHVALEVSASSQLVSEAAMLVAEVTGESTQSGPRRVFIDIEQFAWPSNGERAGQPAVHVCREGDLADHDLTEAAGPGVLAAASGTRSVTLSPIIDLPMALEPGTRVGISGLGAAFDQRQQVLDVRKIQHVAEPQGERINLRDRDLYRAAWPGSALFDECRDLERLWFEMSGFVEADGLDGFHAYDAASTFLAVQGPNGDILSTMRLIWSSPLGFKTLHDLELSAEGKEAVAAIPDRDMAEVGTLATHPGARSMGPTFQMFFALNDMLARRDVTHFISAIDDGLLEIMRGEPTRFPMHDLGESVHYYGAPSTPVIMDVPAYRRQLFSENRPLYRQLIEGDFGTRVP